MLDLPPALAERLAEGVTTLCRCWSLTRRDAVALGFTDHDRDLAFDGLTFEAASGLGASESEAELGLATGGGEVAGALSSARITEADIARGLYDDATVETFLVDWSDPSLRLRLAVHSIGEIRRTGLSFTAELRAPGHRLGEETGRIYQAACPADLGDARCRVDLSDPRFRHEGVIAAAEGGNRLSAGGLAAFADGWFTGGRLTLLSGADAGRSAAVRRHEGDTLALWQPLLVEPGDAFALTAGCDKRFETCREKFANHLNFRGFPHIPTPDFVLRYAVEGEGGHDGGLIAT